MISVLLSSLSSLLTLEKASYHAVSNPMERPMLQGTKVSGQDCKQGPMACEKPVSELGCIFSITETLRL